MPRIVSFARTGGPDVLTLHEVDVPAPGPGEVRVRVAAIGINRAEAMWRRDRYIEPVRLPARLGAEAVGVIDARGDGVTGVAVGDAVCVIPSFSMNAYAMYGELVLAPASALVRQPAGLTAIEAASIWMMFLTAYSALIEDARVGPGDVVLINAASSSVGLAAIQLCAMAGATPVALTRTGAKRERLLRAGARHVIATTEQDLVAEVHAVTGGAGARVALDAVGGPGFETLVEALAVGGTIYHHGELSDQATPLPGRAIVARMQTIKGHTIWKTSGDPARLEAAAAYIEGGLARGALTPVIDRVFTLDDIVAAHRHLESGEQFGKIVVTV